MPGCSFPSLGTGGVEWAGARTHRGVRGLRGVARHSVLANVALPVHAADRTNDTTTSPPLISIVARRRNCPATAG